MQRSARGLAALLGLLLAAAACDPLTDNVPRVGTFVLRSVDGEPVPTALFANENVTTVVVADTIVLYENGTAEESSVRRYQYTAGTTPGSVDRSTQRLDYHQTAGGVELVYRCSPNASCIGPPHLVGRFTEDGMQLDYALYFRVPLVFERVD